MRPDEEARIKRQLEDTEADIDRELDDFTELKRRWQEEDADTEIVTNENESKDGENDEAEKARQVKIMGQIYSRAETTLIQLGGGRQ